MNPNEESTWFAPVKINLFLHITGRITEGDLRGFHELQTYFQRLDYGDSLSFKPTIDPPIKVQWVEGAESIALKPAIEQDDLIYRAAALLQTTALAHDRPKSGVQITLTKNTPIGGGLGGGSSAAATTLLALNKLWDIHLPLNELTRLAGQLGADVPFFLHETNAWAEGIGDQIAPYPSPVANKWFVIVVPSSHTLTAHGFSHPDLKRDEARYQPEKLIDQWLESGYNAFEPIALAENLVIAACDKALRQVSGFSRMTGSGSCLFSLMPTHEEAKWAAREITDKVEQAERVIVARALPDHGFPLHEM